MNNHQNAIFHQITNFLKTPLALLGVDLKNFQFNKICHFANHPYLCKGLNFCKLFKKTMHITIKERLKNIFKKDEPIVISINGKWGVGKTYFWHKSKEELADKKTAYVSLFGKEKIADIRTDIFLQVMSKNEKIVTKTKELVKSIKIPLIDISTLIASLDSQDFKDIIVCFDDFERLSSIKLEEVLGLISELKEQKQCKIVMILNEEELEPEDQETLSKYKEKIVDYEFNYDPSPSDSLNILKDKLTVFKDYPLEKYLIEHKVNNIRIISRIINALNDFSFIQTHIEGEPKVTTEIVGSIIEIAAINAQTSSFDGLIKYVSEKLESESAEFTENVEHEKLLFLIEGDDWNISSFLKSDVVSILRQYCQTSLVDEESLVKIIKSKVDNRNLYSVHENIKTKRDKHLYDMSYEVDSYVGDLWEIFEEHGNKLIIAGDTYLNPRNFMYYMGQLKELDIENKEKYHNFAVEHLKSFIKENLDWMKDDSGDVQKILDFDVSLPDYYKECIKESDQCSINSVEQIITMMRDIRQKHGWNNEPEVLSKVPPKNIEQYILDNPKYVKEVVRFLSSPEGKDLNVSEYTENVISVFQDLSKSQNKNHADKAKKNIKLFRKYK
ncbi:P-loop NTPase fold protein [Candidatus Thiodubiliella endoseptemdiera]|uniref:P-loop NTPase fold protein n=1 Tax=Candidatus Thiodubiliella endoseptemdiera TaxID=2738886 RepID=UPI0034DE26F3